MYFLFFFIPGHLGSEQRMHLVLVQDSVEQAKVFQHLDVQRHLVGCPPHTPARPMEQKRQNQTKTNQTKHNGPVVDYRMKTIPDGVLQQ